MDKSIFEREYLHSVSRIGDRLKMLKRDICKMKDELTYMEEDVELLANAFDTLFKDFIDRTNLNVKRDNEEL